MTSLMVIPSALENSAASFGTDRMGGLARCARAGRPVAGRGRAGPRWQGERAEQDAEGEGGDGECHRDPGDGSLVAALPAGHLLLCWHVLAAVQPAEPVQHPGEVGV
jgi:hypothetical protein